MDRTRTDVRAVLALLVLLPAGPALAQDSRPAPLPEDARYTLRAVDEGFLRLDGRTGQVSLCARRSGEYSCRAVADDRAALEEEISRLKAENLALKTARPLDEAKERLGDLRDQARDAARAVIPNEQEVDRALGIMEGFARRMMRVLREESGQPPGKL